MGGKVFGLGGLTLVTIIAGAALTVFSPAQAMGEESRSSNPLSGDAQAEKAGQTAYRANCAFCHGMRADGRGRGLPNAADLRKYKRGYTRFVEIIKEGFRTMPPWGSMGELTDEEIDQIGAYLETLGTRRANWKDPAGAQSGPSSPKEYEIHLGHILTGWHDTPGEVGLITTLEEELDIAIAHAAYAVTDLEDLDNIRFHTDHVRHAVNPASVRSGQGPGLGYGLVRAAQGVRDHLGYAAGTADASESMTLHAQHVDAATGNVLFWAGKILDRGGLIIGGASPIVSSFFAEEIVEHLEWIKNGRDANGDGVISWEEGEGGLAQMKAHLSYIE